jgi:hypothetical protein
MDNNTTIPQNRPEIGKEGMISNQVGNTALKIDRHIKSGSGRYGTTLLTSDMLNDICLDYINGSKIGKLTKKYSIGYDRILKILNNESGRIDKLRAEIAIKQEKEFVPIVISKRSEILERITPEVIKKAKLGQMASAISDLTNVKRLEQGLSTDNIAIVSKGLSDEQLREYILSGNLGVNKENNAPESNENKVVNEKEGV